MKKLILIPCLILFLASHYTFSQIKNSDNAQINSSYWNISFSAGPTFNSIDRIRSNYKYYPGYNVDFELFYTLEDKKSAIVFSFSTCSEQASSLSSQDFYQSGFTEKKELMFGPRFYLGKNYFVEAAIGNFLIRHKFNIDKSKSQISALFDYDNISAGIGGAIGAGKTFGLSDNIEAVVKAKITFGLPELKTILNTSLNAGIIFKNRKIEKENNFKGDGSNWTVTLTGGIVSPEFLHKANYDIGANYGLEAAIRKSPGIEPFCSLNFVTINEKYTSRDRNLVNLTIGPRFFFGSSKYETFAEMSTGFYIYGNPNDLCLGGNFGPGIILNITKYVAFTAKSNIHIVFNKKSQPGSFLTATGGLRYTL